jgi:hypothetical protein
VRLLAWREDVQMRLRRRGDEMWDKVLAWPLPVRDLLAVSTVVLALGCVIVPALHGGADFERSGNLVETQTRKTAAFVEVVYGERGNDAYYVELGGEEVEVDYGWFIPNPTAGTTVEVVRDPENPSRVIAVGTPQDWADRPWLNVILAAVALAFGLLAAVFAGIRLVPERAEPVLEKLSEASSRLVRRVDHRLRAWFAGGSPPSGRHSSP